MISTGELLELKLRAQDGEIGSVRNLIFHDVDWSIRELVADTGGWLFGRRVGIDPDVVLEPDLVALEELRQSAGEDRYISHREVHTLGSSGWHDVCRVPGQEQVAILHRLDDKAAHRRYALRRELEKSASKQRRW